MKSIASLCIAVFVLMWASLARADDLPAPWQHRFLGPPSPVGNAWFDKANGRFCMWASAAEIWENADSAYFTFRPIKGNFTLTVRLHEGLAYVDGWAKAGLMIRSSNEPGARNTALVITARNGIFRQYRPLDGAGTGATAVTPPEERKVGTRLRISRDGSTIRFAYAYDDKPEWIDAGETQIELPEEAMVGMVWSSHNIGNPQIAAFDQISLDAQPVVVDDARRAELAESRLRPKNNTLYPKLHQRGPMPARAASEFLDSIGVATHISAVATSPAFEEIFRPALLELGIKYIRDGGFEPEFTARIRDLGARGIRYTANLVPRGTLTAAEQVDKEVLPIVDTLVAVEGPNEPDIMPQFATYKGRPWPEGPRLYQQELFAAIKNHKDARVRKLMVLSVPLAHPHVNGTLLGRVPCDAINLHLYQGGALPDDQWATKWLPGARASDPDKPILITETGYHYRHEMAGQPGISERAGARYIPRLALDMFNLGVVRTHLYNLSTDGWGNLRDDGTLRPSMVALRNLITLLSEPSQPNEKQNFKPTPLNLEISGDTRDLRTSLLQKADGRYYLILWLNRYSWDYEARQDLFPAEQAVKVTLGSEARVVIYRPLASTQSIRSLKKSGTVEIAVSDHPIVIEVAKPNP